MRNVLCLVSVSLLCATAGAQIRYVQFSDKSMTVEAGEAGPPLSNAEPVVLERVSVDVDRDGTDDLVFVAYGREKDDGTRWLQEARVESLFPSHADFLVNDPSVPNDSCDLRFLRPGNLLDDHARSWSSEATVWFQGQDKVFCPVGTDLFLAFRLSQAEESRFGWLRFDLLWQGNEPDPRRSLVLRVKDGALQTEAEVGIRVGEGDLSGVSKPRLGADKIRYSGGILRIADMRDKKGKIEVFDLTGQRVLEAVTPPWEIDLSSLRDGAYIVRESLESEQFTHKMTIHR